MNILPTVKSLFGGFVKSIGHIGQLLADSAQTNGENRKLDNAAKGGIFNYRGDKLDDGTDATGWYGDD
jgi:hypothetical protein